MRNENQEWMDATIATLPAELGRLTIAEAAQVMDALNAIYVVCCRTLPSVAENPYWQARLEKLRKTSEMSLAQSRRMLAEWKRQTGWKLPDAASVQRFVWNVTESAK